MKSINDSIVIGLILTAILVIVCLCVGVAYGQCPGGVCPVQQPVFQPGYTPSSTPSYAPTYTPTYTPVYTPVYQPPVVSYPVYQPPVVIPEETKLKVMPEQSVEQGVEQKAPPKKPVMPVVEKETRSVEMNFGIDRSKLHDKPRYCLNGQEVSRSVAIRAAGEPIPEDQNRFRLVLVGSESDIKRVLSDTTKVINERVIVQGYTPDCPLVKQRGWSTAGSPAISLLSPSGKVIARNLDGKYPGKEVVIEAVNRMVNAYDVTKEGSRTGVYDPTRDVDLFAKPVDPKNPNKPGPDGKVPFSPEQIPWYVWLAGGLIITLLLRKEK